MTDKVVSIVPGVKPASDEEREFVEFFAQRLRGYVERYGHIPDAAVFAVYGSDGENGMDWGTFFMSPRPRSKVEACGVGAALLLRDL